MLLSLLLIAWLAAVTLCVALCRMAVRGDAAEESIANRSCSSIGGVPAVLDDYPGLRLYKVRSAPRARRTAHGARRHRPPSEAGP